MNISSFEIEENQLRCKAIIVGDSGVGKTSIISRYLRKYNSNEKPTIGASFTNKLEIINDKRIVFEIWDTAGQERFRSINTIFYQDASICILAYDITSQKSFQNLKDYWYKAVLDQASGDIIFHVVGNKIDLFANEKVDRKEVEEFGNNIGAEISYISTKEETNTYVDALFQKIGKKFLESDIFKVSEISLQLKKSEKVKLKKKGKKDKKCC